MSWMIPRYKAEGDQDPIVRDLVNTNRSALIQGPAGSGKSVMLVWTVQDILEKHPNKRVCMVLFTRSLIDMMKTGIPEHLSDRVHIFTTYDFQRNQFETEWDLVIVDEFQDINRRLLDKIFYYGRQIILAGDIGQSIYENGCAIDYFDAVDIDKPRLKMIRRLTKSIQRIACYFADNPEDFIKFEVDKRIASVSVQLTKYPSQDSEIQNVWLRAREYAWNGVSSAVIFPENADLVKFSNTVLAQENKSPWQATYKYYGTGSSINYKSLNNHLSKHEVQLQVIGKGAGTMREADAQNLVSIMTYHSAKGLDFEAVFLPKLTRSTTFWSKPDIARRMFFVALTRSRRDLFLSYHDDPHEFVERIPKHLLSFQEFSEEEQRGDVTLGADVIDF